MKAKKRLAMSDWCVRLERLWAQLKAHSPLHCHFTIRHSLIAAVFTIRYSLVVAVDFPLASRYSPVAAVQRRDGS
jgi:hypothetical protein